MGSTTVSIQADAPAVLYYFCTEHASMEIGTIEIIDNRCHACLPDHFCNGFDDYAFPCPQNTVSPPSSSVVTHCTCDLGYTHDRDGEPCAACLEGEYKNFTGAFPCLECPYNTFRDTKAGKYVTDCTPCMPNSYTEESFGHESIRACLCEPGWFHVNISWCSPCVPGTFNARENSSQCTLCPAGSASQHYEAISNNTCEVCPSNTYSREGQSLCTVCNLHAVSVPGSTNITGCKCIPGYTGPDGGKCRVSGRATLTSSSASRYRHCERQSREAFTAAGPQSKRLLCLECADQGRTIRDTELYSCRLCNRVLGMAKFCANDMKNFQQGRLRVLRCTECKLSGTMST